MLLRAFLLLLLATSTRAAVGPFGPTLRSLAEQHGLYMGAAANIGVLHNDSETTYRTLLPQQYSIITAENCMKWESTEPQPGNFTLSDAKDVLAFADANQLHVRGHNLVWHRQLPAWLCAEYNGTVCIRSAITNRTELKAVLQRHVQTLAGALSSSPVVCWDVVNEAVCDWETNTTLWNDIWNLNFGPDYVQWAFEWAREAAPDLRLFYNDYDIHNIDRKSDAVYDLLSSLLKKGVPIDGIGFQMHVALESVPDPLPHKYSRFAGVTNMTANLQRFADLGLEIHITEMDVGIANGTGSIESRLEQQAVVYEQALVACLSVPACKAFESWGFTDRYTWLKPPDYPSGEEPLPFDNNYQPKPAYFGMQSVLNLTLPR